MIETDSLRDRSNFDDRIAWRNSNRNSSMILNFCFLHFKSIKFFWRDKRRKALLIRQTTESFFDETFDESREITSRIFTQTTIFSTIENDEKTRINSINFLSFYNLHFFIFNHDSKSSWNNFFQFFYFDETTTQNVTFQCESYVALNQRQSFWRKFRWTVQTSSICFNDKIHKNKRRRDHSSFEHRQYRSAKMMNQSKNLYLFEEIWSSTRWSWQLFKRFDSISELVRYRQRRSKWIDQYEHRTR